MFKRREKEDKYVESDNPYVVIVYVEGKPNPFYVYYEHDYVSSFARISAEIDAKCAASNIRTTGFVRKEKNYEVHYPAHRIRYVEVRRKLD